MIFNNLPSDWKDLQDKVALILEQCGFKVESPKDLRSARSEIIEVDVYAIDESSILQQTVVCECKYWDKKVPQSVVHFFRAQIEDIVSRKAGVPAENIIITPIHSKNSD